MLTGKRVMLVEDEAIITMMLEDYLADLGYQVISTASRLDEALEKAGSVPADVAVLDVDLAGQLSYPVAEILRARTIPFLFATGYCSAGLPRRLSDVVVLEKPFVIHQLAEALQIVAKH